MSLNFNKQIALNFLLLLTFYRNNFDITVYSFYFFYPNPKSILTLPFILREPYTHFFYDFFIPQNL
jgi:hypothetical protein